MNTKLYVKRFDTGTTVDVSEDFTLPDYQPEMRRVIGVRATPTVDGKYLSGDELEADGGVTYTVLYMDGSGQLAQASQTSTYTGHVPLKTEDDLYGVGDIVLSAASENVNCRVTAPRRFTLSSRVRLAVMSQKGADCSLKVGGDQTATVRRKTETHTTASLAEVRKSCEASGQIREQAGVRVIMAQGEAALSDVKMSQSSKNEASVKGDAYVNLLIETPDGSYATARGRAPIDEKIPLPETTAESVMPAAFASVVMTEIDVGEDGTIEWSMEYDIDCDLIRTEMAEVTKDAYLTDYEDKLTVAEYQSYKPAAAVNGRLTTNGSMKLRPDMTYLTAWGSGCADKCEISGGRLKISGSSRVSVVTVGGGEAVTDEVMIPFRYECDCGTAEDRDDSALTKRTLVTVPEISVRENGETLEITAELSIAAVMLGEEQVNAAVTIAPSGESRKNDGEERGMIRVYVPDEDETPWDVEKKFRLSESLKADGRLYVI